MFVESLVGHWEWCKSTALRNMGHNALTASSSAQPYHIDCPAAVHMGHNTLTASSSAQTRVTWGTPHWLPAAMHRRASHGAHHLDCQQLCTDARHMVHPTLTASSCAQMCGTWCTPPWLPAALHRLRGFVSPFPSGLLGPRCVLQICVIPHKTLPILGRWYGKCVQHNQELAHKERQNVGVT